MEYPFKDLLPLDEVLEREGYYKDWTHLDPKVFYSLTQISEYIKTKGFGVDVRLLIAQLAEHFSLKTSQINRIELFFKDVMQELAEDKDFHSLPEIAGARRGYSTLGESLGNLSVDMINKNLGKLDGSFFSDEFIDRLSNGSVDVTKLLDDSVQSNHITNRSVEARHFKEETTILGKNLYNKLEHYEADKFVNVVTGAKSNAVGWGLVDIPVKPHSTYSFVKNSNIVTNTALSKIKTNGGTVIVDFKIISNYRNGSVEGKNVYTFETGEANHIYITVKIPDQYDDSDNLMLFESSSIDKKMLEGPRIKTLFGVPVNVDLSADDISLPYEGKKWVVVGDSLTEINSRSLKFYHQYVADDLGITVHNMGQSGTGYKRSNPFYDRVSNIPTDADVVTIFGSFNDLGAGVPLGTKDDTGVDTLGGAINTTIDNLYAHLPTVPLGIISPTPWHTSQPWNDEHTTSLYAKLLKDICKDRGIPFLDLYYSSGLRPWEANYRPLMYSRDDGNGVHPDENGHKLFYPQIREFLKTLI